MEQADDLGRGLSPGDPHYRAYVGPPEKYDLVAGMQFNLLTALGLRESHFLLDIGCGSLRAGRLLIPYLLPGRYFGIEPNEWLVQEGIEKEIGRDLVRLREPRFTSVSDFNLRIFGQEFDFLLAQSIFSHAPTEAIRTCLREARAVLAPEGIFAATFFQGTEDHRGQDWVYPGCVWYRLEHLRDLGREFGLDCEEVDWPHPNGQTWVVFTHSDRHTTWPRPVSQMTVDRLEAEVEAWKGRHAELYGHPWVRVGRTINGWQRALFARSR